MLEQFKKFSNVRQIFEILFKWKSFCTEAFKKFCKSEIFMSTKTLKMILCTNMRFFFLMPNFQEILLAIKEILKRIQIFRFFQELNNRFKISYCIMLIVVLKISAYFLILLLQILATTCFSISVVFTTF